MTIWKRLALGNKSGNTANSRWKWSPSHDGDVKFRLLTTAARVSAPPKHGLRTGIPYGPDRDRQNGQRLNGRGRHRDHEVFAGMGAGRPASASGLRACTRINRPTLQTGQRRTTGSLAAEPLAEPALLSTLCCARSNDRHRASCALRLRFARKPKWRM